MSICTIILKIGAEAFLLETIKANIHFYCNASTRAESVNMVSVWVMLKTDHLNLEDVSGATVSLQLLYFNKLVTKLSQWDTAIRCFLGRFRM